MSNIPPVTQNRCKYPPTNDLSVLALESDEEVDGSPETIHIWNNSENNDQEEKACAPDTEEVTETDASMDMTTLTQIAEAPESKTSNEIQPPRSRHTRMLRNRWIRPATNSWQRSDYSYIKFSGTNNLLRSPDNSLAWDSLYPQLSELDSAALALYEATEIASNIKRAQRKIEEEEEDQISNDVNINQKDNENYDDAYDGDEDEGGGSEKDKVRFDFEYIWKLLVNRFGFRMEKGKYCLPDYARGSNNVFASHGNIADSGIENIEERSWDNPIDLRRHLCKHGIEIPSNVYSVDEVLNIEEQDYLTLWIRYAAFPSLASLTEVSTIKPFTYTEFCHIIRHKLGFKFASSIVKLPGVDTSTKKNLEIGVDYFPSFDCFCLYLAQYGMGKFVEPGDKRLDEVEKTRCALYIAEHRLSKVFFEMERIVEHGFDSRVLRKRKSEVDSIVNRTSTTINKKVRPSPGVGVSLDTNVPVRFNYNNTKSVNNISSLIDPEDIVGPVVDHYYETLGRCNNLSGTFFWSNKMINGLNVDHREILHYDFHLGRVYFKGFWLRGAYYEVGDFVIEGGNSSEESEGSEIHRIAAAYQACKSFIGKWNTDSDQIQKRGHPYVLLIPMKEMKTYLSSRTTKEPLPQSSIPIERELLLEKVHRYCPRNINILPQAISDFSESLRKVKVDVSDFEEDDCDTKSRKTRKIAKVADYFCRRVIFSKTVRHETKKQNRKSETYDAVRPIKDSELSLLTYNSEDLLKNFIPNEWDSYFNIQQIQLMTERSDARDIENERNPQSLDDGGVKLSYTEFSSDDSDGFDEESRLQILSSSKDDVLDAFDSASESENESQDDTSSTNCNNERDRFIRSLAAKPDKEEQLVQLAVSGEIYNGDAKLRQEKIDRQKMTDNEFLQRLKGLEGWCQRNNQPNEITGLTRTVEERIWSEKALNSMFHVESSENQNEDSSIWNPVMNKLNEILHQLGYEEFRSPQDRVCFTSVTTNSDIIYLAPTGHGKSLSYIIPALYRGKITLVIEPLKEIINDQMQKINKEMLKAHHLLSVRDVQQKGGMHGIDQLTLIANSFSRTTKTRKKASQEIILFATPELVEQEGVLGQLQRINSFGQMNRIVFDEFDVSADKYREVYDGILSKLSESLEGVPFMFLSATSKHGDLVQFLGDLPRARVKKPHLFLPKRPISPSLSFSVERKESGSQVVTRISFIIKQFAEKSEEYDQGKKPKGICYCLTKKNCEETAERLRKVGVKAKAVHAQYNRTRIDGIVNDFKKGKTQILCATEVLGRGIDIPDIRFIFHTFMPLSIRQYIQQSGRGGRDGNPCFCILFYRPQDRTTAERVKRIKPPDGKNSELVLKGKDLEKAVSELDAVMEYCISGYAECRYSLLSNHVLLLKKEVNANLCCGPGFCDYCQKKPLFIKKENNKVVVRPVQINYFVIDLLKKFSEKSLKKATGLPHTGKESMSKLLTNLAKDYSSNEKNDEMDKNHSWRTKWPAICSFLPGSFSLKNDLLRLLVGVKILEVKNYNYFTGNDFLRFLHDLQENKVQIWLRNVRFLESSEFILSTPDAEEQIHGANSPQKRKIISIDNEVPLCKQRKMESSNIIDRSIYLGERRQSIQSSNPAKECSFYSYPAGTENWLPHLPFLYQFEVSRVCQENRLTNLQLEDIYLYLQRSNEKGDVDRFNVCCKLHEMAKTSYSFSKCKKIVEAASRCNLTLDEGNCKGSFGLGSALYFTSKLQKDGSLTLLPVEIASDRRIYRKFGSHRFLHVNIKSDVPKRHVYSLITSEEPIWICGRRYAYLWSKATKTPQTFILFAESGVGITEAEERSAQSVREWCIPPKLNSSLTIGKELKRLKLSFSKTTAAGILPPKCVEIVDDIFDELGNVRTDGCGLLSRDALDFIWKAYNANKNILSKCFENSFEDDADTVTGPSEEVADESDDEESTCFHTSVQGRLGGFKGMWVLDERLGEGIRIICRSSQNKYNVPMQSLLAQPWTKELSEEDYDEFYNTFEVCSWDETPKNGHLSIRHVQILESRGVPFEVFNHIANRETQKLFSDIEDREKLFVHLNQKRSAMISTSNSDAAEDTFVDQLFSMARVNLDKNEPVFKKKLKTMVIKETESIRNKAKYQSGVYLRLIPDHTTLLEDGEAFMALGQETKANARWIRAAAKATHVVAMRNPAYFSGDLLKLKLVTKKTLRERVARISMEQQSPLPLVKTSVYDGAGNDPYAFFEKFKVGLVLNVKGARCYANMMSGGDFDGDTAWCCWDESLVMHVKDCPPQDTSNLNAKKSPEEGQLSSKATILNRCDLALNYRKHQAALGKLSKMLDKVLDSHGFQSEAAQAIGEQLFLQVDHPYYLCEIPNKIRDQLATQTLSEPHWVNSNNKSNNQKLYMSTKALGKLWDLLEEKIRTCTTSFESKTSQRSWQILGIINEYIDESLHSKNIEREIHIANLRRTMKKANQEHAKQYNDFKNTEDSKDKEKLSMWLNEKYLHWNKTLIQSEKGEDGKNLAAAVLYEQCHPESEFPWRVALERLLRIFSDANARQTGKGDIAITMDRHNEKVMCRMARNRT